MNAFLELEHPYEQKNTNKHHPQIPVSVAFLNHNTVHIRNTSALVQCLQYSMWTVVILLSLEVKSSVVLFKNDVLNEIE